jgi:dinuclear metal center YbgI/SA1388 family protein
MSLPLTSLLSALEALAPLTFAEKWDNVGLLVDPREEGRELEVERALLTIDATPAVLREAKAARVQCLIAYHPPLFAAKKRLSARADPAVFAAFQQGFAVYSPHTALDSAPLGLNDWLTEGLGAGELRALSPHTATDPGAELKLVVFTPQANADSLREALAEAGAGTIGAYSQCSFNIEGEGTFFGDESTRPVVGSAGCLERVPETRLEMVCPKRALPALASAIVRVHPYEQPAWEVYPLAEKPHTRAGSGRELVLERAITIHEAVERVKRHLGLERVRLAASERHASGAPLTRIAVCAGSGGSVFEGHQAELFLTGEMRHHDVLGRVNAGQSVILCEHTPTERGYLPVLQRRLFEATGGGCELLLAHSDREPLTLV